MAEPSKNLVNERNPVVLISPLDWGMGHTTRCIPIIRALTKLPCSIIIACNSIQKSLLQKDFPSLRYVDLNGYNIFYGRDKSQTLIQLIRQIPKILTSIKEERWFLEDFLAQNEIDLIISDNRYGFFHPKAFSVMITHQLELFSGVAKWLDRQGQRQVYRFLTHFDLCLIPDQQGGHSIAGKLSNPSTLPSIPTKYIGPLSRFSVTTHKADPKHLLIILSGPEPQRSVLEKKILQQVKELPYTIVLVRGTNLPLKVPVGNIEVINIAESKELEQLIDDASMVICRAGYSSFMDLFIKQKKILAIPTPGQGEQEYLAKKLGDEGYIFTTKQKNLDLEKQVLQALAMDLKIFPIHHSDVELEMQNILQLAIAKKSGLTFAPQNISV